MNPTVSGSIFGSREFDQSNIDIGVNSLTPVYSVLPSPFASQGQGIYSDPFKNTQFGQVETALTMRGLEGAKGQTVLQPDEIKKQYNLDTKVPMNTAQIALMTERVSREARMAMRNEFLDDRITSGGLKTFGRDLVTSAAGGMLSPTGLATGYLSKGIDVAVKLPILSFAASSAIEGGLEVAGGLGLRKYGYNYGALDIGADLLAGPLVVGGLKGAGKGINFTLKKLNLDIASLMGGKKPHVNNPLDVIHTEVSKVVQPDVASPAIPKITGVQTLSKDDFNSMFKTAKGTTIAVPNSAVDLSLKAQEFSPDLPTLTMEQAGFTSKVKAVEDMKVIDGEVQVPKEIEDSLYKALIDTEYANEIEDSKLADGLGVFLENLNTLKGLDPDSKAFDIVSEELKKLGIDAVTYKATDITGAKIEDPTIMVLNKDKLGPVGSSEPAKVGTKKTASEASVQQEAKANAIQQDTAYSESIESNIHYNKPIWEQIHKIDINKFNVDDMINKSTEALEMTLKEIEVELSKGFPAENKSTGAGTLTKVLKTEDVLFEKLVKESKINKVNEDFFYHTGSLVDIEDFNLSKSTLTDVYYGGGFYAGSAPSEGFTYISKAFKKGMGDIKRFKILPEVKLANLKSKGDDIASVVNAYFKIASEWEVELNQDYHNSLGNKDYYGAWRAIRQSTQMSGKLKTKANRLEFFKALYKELKKTGFDGIKVTQKDGPDKYMETVLWALTGKDLKGKIEEVPLISEVVTAEMLKQNLAKVDEVLKAGIFCVRNK